MNKIALAAIVTLLAVLRSEARLPNGCAYDRSTNCTVEPSFALSLAAPAGGNTWPIYNYGDTVNAKALIVTNWGELTIFTTNEDCSWFPTLVLTNSHVVSSSWIAVGPDSSYTNTGSGLTASFTATHGVGVGDITFYLTFSNSLPCTNLQATSLHVHYQAQTNDVIEGNCASDTPVLLSAWGFDPPLSLWSGESNANDSVGTYNGTWIGSASYTNGIVGAAFYFNGSSYVSCGTNVGNFGTNDFTIDFWVKTTQTGSSYIVGKRPICNLANLWNVRMVDGHLYLESIENTSGYAFTTLISDSTVNDGVFHHVTITRDGALQAIYIDDAFDNAIESDAIANLNNNVELWVGHNVCGGSFVGVVDELSILTGSASPWVGSRGQGPLVITNIQQRPSPWGNSLQVDSSTNASLSYRYFDEDGIANINCKSGAVRFWIKPNWNGGTGPGSPGRLIEMGDTNSTSGWWSLSVNSSGNQISFQTKSNGNLTTYFTQSISDWNSGYWYHIVLNYAADQTALYTNGILAQTGIGLTNYPTLATREAYGFSIGSDHSGANRSASRFDEFATFCAPLSAEDILDDYVNGLMSSTVGVGTGIPDWDTYNQLHATTNNGALEVFTPLK